MLQRVTAAAQPSLVRRAALTALLCLAGCSQSSTVTTNPVTPVTPVTPVAPVTPNPLASVVFLGDSLTAGYQNGSLLDTQQTHGYANLIATQAGFPITLPLVAPPGLPAVLTLLGTGLPPQLGQESGTTTGRDNPAAQATDLAVPGYKVHDVIYTTPSATPGTGFDFTQLVLGYPPGNLKSQLDETIALQPSTVFLWIGNNDVLGAASSGSTTSITDIADFTTDYTLLMSKLKATTAHLFVANIPDVTKCACLIPAPQVTAAVASETGLTQASAGQQLGIGSGDLVTLTGIGDVETEVNGYKAGKALTPLTDADVLSASEIVTVEAATNSFNQVVAQQVAAVGGTLVDLYSYINSFGSAGLTINGYSATTAYLGGLIGLDAVHPTDTGYALLANQFIATMNTALGLKVAAVNVSQVAANDPYFGPNIKPVGSMRNAPELARRLDQLLFARGSSRH